MSFLRNWPESLFVVLVIVIPLAFATLLPAQSFGGFIVRIVLGMLAGGLVWLTIIVVSVAFAKPDEDDELPYDEEQDDYV